MKIFTYIFDVLKTAQRSFVQIRPILHLVVEYRSGGES